MFRRMLTLVFMVSLSVVIGCGASGDADAPDPNETPTATVQPAPAPTSPANPAPGATQKPASTPMPQPAETPATSLEPAEGQAAKAPKIACDEPIYDFGVQNDSGSVDHTFTIRNDGNAKLVIRSIQTSCGCTVAKMEKQILEPGESDTIKTTFHMEGRQGKQLKYININCNDPENRTFKLTLKGKIIAPIMMVPNRISFGQVPTGEEHVKEVRVFTEREDIEFTITELKSSRPDILTDYTTVRPGKEYLLRVKLSESTPAGILDGMVNLHTDFKERAKLSLVIYANMMGPVRYMPNRIIVREKDDPAIRATRQIRVLPGKVEHFKILEVITPDDEIVVTITERAPNDYVIILANLPVTGALNNKEIVIKLDTEENDEIRIPISGGRAPVRGKAVKPASRQENANAAAPAK